MMSDVVDRQERLRPGLSVWCLTMDGHDASKALSRPARGTLDVTFRSRWFRGDDGQPIYSSRIQVDELPGALVFHFRPIVESDGRHRWAVVGMEIGSQASEFTPEHLKKIYDGYGRYRKIAELYLTPVPEIRQAAEDLRRRMGNRSPREKWTDGYLKGVALEAETRLAAGDTLQSLADDLPLSRKQLSRQINEAHERELTEGLPQLTAHLSRRR
jgi:hypothetical protein